MEMRPKIMVAAGGTGGHVFPGVAVADEIRRISPNASVTFVGTKRGLETRVLPLLGYPIKLIGSTSVKDRGMFGKIAAYSRVPFSVMHAFSIMLKDRPDLLLSVGGYAAGPFAVAAVILCVPFAILEPNAVAGMSNRIMGRFARRVFVAFDAALKYFPRSKVLVSGNPVRREVLNIKKAEAKENGVLNIFVFGGSQGARRLNQAMTGALKYLEMHREKIFVAHQTGTVDDAAAIRQLYIDAGVKALVFSFTDKIWEYYEKADLVIARSGAMTISELSALAMPSILVPYPYAADDHQRANAMALVEAGGAVMIPDSECTAQALAGEIREFIERPERLVMMKLALERCAKRDATQKIAGELLSLRGTK